MFFKTFKLLLLLLVLFMIISSSALSELKNDFWISVENGNLKYTQVTGGLLLKNDGKQKIRNIEIQTFPSASNGMTRVFGIGSYYYRLDALEQNDVIKIYWEKFSNAEGNYLKLNEYSFNRICISGTEGSGDNKKAVNEHFGIDPQFTIENRGFKIKIN